MSRAPKLILLCLSSLAVAGMTAACGTENIALKPSDPNYAGAQLFNQRCSGCHTLSYAATHGSAANVRTAEYNNGPNFDQRCERPMTRVLYAIENGGFSGGIMPQNVVVGQQAIEVARFVATYSGRKAPKVPGVPTCQQKQIGSIPPLSAAGTASATKTASSAVSTTAKSGGKLGRSPGAKAGAKAKRKHP